MIHIHWTNVTTDYCPKRGETTWALVTHLFSNTPGLLCSDVTGLCFEGGTFGQHSPVCLCFWETFSPFDCAFEVWLADGAVVYEDGWTGAVFLWEWTRGHLHTFKKTQHTINWCSGDRRSRMLPTFLIFWKFCVIIVLF